MHVRFASLFVVLAALWAPAAHADAPAGVRVLACAPWEEAVRRGRDLRGTHAARCPARRACCFGSTCSRSTGDGEFERVSAEGLGVWRKSRPGAGVFRYQQRVRGLHRGAVYRAVVQYRWLGDDGEPILTARA